MSGAARAIAASAPAPIVVEGRGLHGGAHARVTLTAIDGPTTLRASGVEAPLTRWRAEPAERSTLLAHGDARVRTVEHLLSAVAALGLHDGAHVDVDGAELPILDGTSAPWFDALASWGRPPTSPRLVVAREGEIAVGLARYRFVPGDAVHVVARVELGDPRVANEAEWRGAADEYRARVAVARTFCFAAEVEELARRGLAQHVTPEMVVVLGPSILCAGRPFEADEPPRHKLLDLIGDLAVYGGPPRGRVEAYRPGHWSTHQAMREAIARGLVAPVR